MSEKMPALSIHGGSKFIVYSVAIFFASLIFIYLTMDLEIPVFGDCRDGIRCDSAPMQPDTLRGRHRPLWPLDDGNSLS